jgi:hypothetical protein
MQQKQHYNGKLRTLIEQDFDDISIAAAGQPSWSFTTNFGNYPKGEEFAVLFDVLGNDIFKSNGRRPSSFKVINSHLIIHKKNPLGAAVHKVIN